MFLPRASEQEMEESKDVIQSRYVFRLSEGT